MPVSGVHPLGTQTTGGTLCIGNALPACLSTRSCPATRQPGHPCESIDLRVNDQRRRVEVELPDKAEADNLWVVRFKEVPLDAAHKENAIVVRVGNTEAACVEPARVEVVRVPEPPPVLEFLEPREKCNVHEPDLTVRLRVESEQPLRQLQRSEEDVPAAVLLQRRSN